MAAVLAMAVLLSACQHHRSLSSTPAPETTAPPPPVATAPPTVEPPVPAPAPAPAPAPVIAAAPVIVPLTPAAPLEPITPVTPVLEAGGAAMVLPPGPVSVALLLPLSGPSAELGQALFEAAQLALFDVGNEDFVLLPLDTVGTY